MDCVSVDAADEDVSTECESVDVDDPQESEGWRQAMVEDALDMPSNQFTAGVILRDMQNDLGVNQAEVQAQALAPTSAKQQDKPSTVKQLAPIPSMAAAQQACQISIPRRKEALVVTQPQQPRAAHERTSVESGKAGQAPRCLPIPAGLARSSLALGESERHGSGLRGMEHSPLLSLQAC
jgi:hypothetical protein